MKVMEEGLRIVEVSGGDRTRLGGGDEKGERERNKVRD